MHFTGVNNQPWQDRSECVSEDPALFMSEYYRYQDKAKAVCSRCPVRTDCLVFALKSEKGDASFRTGIYGGLTGTERAELRLCNYADCVKVKPTNIPFPSQGWYCKPAHREAHFADVKAKAARKAELSKEGMQLYYQQGRVNGYA